MSGGLIRSEAVSPRAAWRGASAGLVLGLAALGGTAAEAATIAGSLRGGAYGLAANAKAGPVSVNLDRSASAANSCRGTDGEVISRSSASITAGPGGSVLTGRLTQATAFGVKSATSARGQQTARVTGLSALGGLIRADSVLAVATVTVSKTKIDPSFSGSAFANLRINGRPVSASMPANTRIALPGVGSVTLKKIAESADGTRGSINIEMLKVNVEQANRFGLPVGAELTIAQASAGYSRAIPSDVVLAGQAFLTAANAKAESAAQNRIGRAAPVGFGCEGTLGETRTNAVASVNVDKVLSFGEGGTTAFAGRTSSGARTAKTTATTEAVRLLNGLITASSVKAVAIDTVSNGVRRSSTSGSGISGLRIAGRSIGNVTQANVELPLPGIGTVVLNEQFIPERSEARRVMVNGIHVRVTQANPLLPVGSEFIVSHAESIARKPEVPSGAGS